MARIRTIKPEFFTSEDIVALDPMSRLLYIALWCEADREGRMVWKPRTFKMRYFPVDNCDIDAMCDALVDSGLIQLYGDGLAFIPQFTSHQAINPREGDSKLPVPDMYMRVTDASVTRDDACNEDEHAAVTPRQEGKGKEGNSTRQTSTRKKQETPIPDDFTISDAVRAWAETNGYDQLDLHLSNFIDSCKAKDYRYRDWDAAFRKAISSNWARLSQRPKPVENPKEIIPGTNLTRARADFLQRMGL